MYIKLMTTSLILFLTVSNAIAQTNIEKATFAGGCFWCMEPPFEKLDGVKDVLSGYTGGQKMNPTYKEVSAGKTNHLEAIQITYDPSKITFQELLDVFWMQIDPTDTWGQFADKGSQYKTAIFYHGEIQKRLAEESIKILGKSKIYKKPIVTKIRKASNFYPAEEYHQDYYKKNYSRYKSYRYNSGREPYLNKIWNDENKLKLKNKKEKTYMKPSKAEIKKKLTPLQFKVTQENGTERAFNNEYWDNNKEGIYVDIVTGEPLFSSTDKFKSGTGWPSFTKPIEKKNTVNVVDKSHFMTRTEIRSKQGDSHLGHLFKDGPKPTGLRYCINSASLEFIRKDKMKERGYEDILWLFK